MHFRSATATDAERLAEMNWQAIRDEGHRNPLTREQLARRMTMFLAGEYEAVVFEQPDSPIGYALYKREPEWIYLRQFFIRPEVRRQGLACAALEWVMGERLGRSPPDPRRSVDRQSGVLDFWRAIGFADYCLTLELDRDVQA